MTIEQKQVNQCREDFETHVRHCIKEHVREKFLKSGSEHWLDFKAGWFAAHVPTLKQQRKPDPSYENWPV